MAMFPRGRSDTLPRGFRLGVLLLSPIVFGALAVALRQDSNWDLRNYHYYNPYAYLTGRLGFDIGPAAGQTFFNPLLDIPFFLLIQHVAPPMVGFALGAVQGLTFWLVFEIARGVWSEGERVGAVSLEGVIFALVCAGLGMYGAGAASELGTTFHDLTLSPLVLAALAFLLRASSRPRAASHLFMAGLLLGIAAGLKYALAMYVPAMAVALLVGNDHGWRERAIGLARWTAGVAAGVMLTAGYWMYTLYVHFGNPLAPYFNPVFRSPYFPPGSRFDTRFFPKTILQTVFYPFYFHRFHGQPSLAMENPFQDLRWAVLYVLGVVVAAFVLVTRLRGREGAPTMARNHRILLVFAAVSYLVWQYLFSVYRYLIPLEVLCPLITYVCLCVLIPRESRTRVTVCFALFVLIAAAVRPARWEHVPWSASFFGTRVPQLSEPANTVVLMTGLPTAFVIPAFPKEVRFVRVDRFSRADQNTRFVDVVRSLVRTHSGDFYLLWHRQEVTDPDRYLVPYGLTADLDRCSPVTNNVDPDIMLCRVSRTEKAAGLRDWHERIHQSSWSTSERVR